MLAPRPRICAVLVQLTKSVKRVPGHHRQDDHHEGLIDILWLGSDADAPVVANPGEAERLKRQLAQVHS